jgi:hypothetical protein
MGHAACGCLNDPGLWASALYRPPHDWNMALLRVLTGCMRVYAALESRIRKALQDPEATFPNLKGQPVQHSTAR